MRKPTLRILLDHCLPRQIAGLLPGHEVMVARRMDWDALLNGDLLHAAEQGGFECLLTGDCNLAYQQNLGGRKIAIVELSTNRLKVVRAQIGTVIDALNRVQGGEYVQVMLEPPALRRRNYRMPEQ